MDVATVTKGFLDFATLIVVIYGCDIRSEFSSFRGYSFIQRSVAAATARVSFGYQSIAVYGALTLYIWHQSMKYAKL